MKKYSLIILFFTIATYVNAQNIDTSKSATVDSSKFLPIDTEPSFPKGDFGFLRYISKNEKPSTDQGKVLISFIVEKDGSLSNIQVIRSLSESADKEAIRLINESPKWSPGKQGKRPVRVRYSTIINFPPLKMN
jgi:TonB family protein